MSFFHLIILGWLLLVSLGPFVQPLSLCVQPAIPFSICHWQHLELIGQSSSVPTFGMNLCSGTSSADSRHTNLLARETISAHHNLRFTNKWEQYQLSHMAFPLGSSTVLLDQRSLRYCSGCAKAPNLTAYLQTHLGNMWTGHSAVSPPPSLPKRIHFTPVFHSNLVDATTLTTWGRDSIWGFVDPFDLE